MLWVLVSSLFSTSIDRVIFRPIEVLGSNLGLIIKSNYYESGCENFKYLLSIKKYTWTNGSWYGV